MKKVYSGLLLFLCFAALCCALSACKQEEPRWRGHVVTADKEHSMIYVVMEDGNYSHSGLGFYIEDRDSFVYEVGDFVEIYTDGEVLIQQITPPICVSTEEIRIKVVNDKN